MSILKLEIGAGIHPRGLYIFELILSTGKPRKDKFPNSYIVKQSQEKFPLTEIRDKRNTGSDISRRFTMPALPTASILIILVATQRVGTYIDLFTQKERRPDTKEAEPLEKGWMRGRVGRHRACRRERVRTEQSAKLRRNGKERKNWDQPGQGDSTHLLKVSTPAALKSG